MTAEPRGPRPAVYARLSEEAEVKLIPRSPHPFAQAAGWVLVVAIAVAVLLAVFWAG